MNRLRSSFLMRSKNRVALVIAVFLLSSISLVSVVSAATINVYPNAIDGTDTADGQLSEITANDATCTPDSASAIVADDGCYTVDKSDIMRFSSFDTSGIPFGSTINGVVLHTEWGAENGYSGNNYIRYLNSSSVLTNTGLQSSDLTGWNAVYYDLYTADSAAVDTVTEVTNMDIEFTSNDGAGASAMHLDYLYMAVDYTPTPLTLSGTLYDTDGSPITSGKTVVAAFGTSTPSLYSTTTDGSGNFSITGPVAHGLSTATTWATSTDSENSNEWHSVTYGNGRFVAVGRTYSGLHDYDAVMYSDDGVSWATTTAAGDNDTWYGVTYGNGRFVAVGATSGGTNDAVMYSDDGVSWTIVSAAGDNDNWNSITYGNGRFVAVGDFGTDRVMYSDDGITWATTTAAGNDDGWNSITYGNGRFVAVGDGGVSGTDRVMYSDDGITWATTTAAGNDDGWNSITYGNGRFVAVGSSGDRVMTSPDGITWTSRSAAGANDIWYGVTYGNGRFVAVGYNGDRVMHSDDGVTWTVASAVGNDGTWTSVTYGNGRFVAVGGNGTGDHDMYADAGFGDTTPITLYVDGDAVDATTLTYGPPTSTTTLSGISLIQDTVRFHHSSTSGDFIIHDGRFEDFYDSEDDVDILFTATSSATTTITADVEIAAGTTLYPRAELRLGGDFNIQGDFEHQRGEVVMSSASGQTITTVNATTTFNVFTATSSNTRTLTFTSGDEYVFLATTTINGSSGNFTSLDASTPDSEYYFRPYATATASYLNVQDSHNISATTTSISCISCIDGGNNSGWDIQAVKYTSLAAATSTDPASFTIAPGSTATVTNAFTFVGEAADTITEITLAHQNASSTAKIEIVSNDGATVYGSTTAASGTSTSITLDTNISVTTSTTTYKIRMTPKTHANLPSGNKGQLIPFTATILSWTGSNTATGTDQAFPVTIDNQSLPSFGISDTSSFAGRVDYSANFDPYSVVAADFDNDGYLDLATAQYGVTTNASVFINDGDGTFAAKVAYNVNPGNAISVEAGDLNNDGYQDMAVADYGSNSAAVLINDGDGTFATAVEYSAGNGVYSITISDFDNDGYADMAVANSTDNDVSIFINNGDGTFATKVDYVTGTSPTFVTAGDFNNDGYADLVLTDPSFSNVSVLINDGDGTFATKVDYGVGNNPRSIALGDFNKDGYIDLAVTNYGNSNVSVLINDGDGTFATKVDYGTGTGPRSIAAGDFNNDGYLDVVTANIDANSTSVLINDGDGTFATKVDYTTGNFPEGITTGDFDNDGLVDIAATYRSGSPDGVSVFISNATSTLTVSAGDAQATVSYTTPPQDDLDSIVILRSTSAVTDAPVDGTTYSGGETIGSATVACVDSSVSTGTADSCTTTSLTNGTPYYFAAFVKDSYGNYSYAVEPTGSPVTPVSTTTVAVIPATSVATSTATLNGDIYATGGANATTRGFRYSTSSDFSSNVATSSESGSYSTGTFTANITGLENNTTYYVQAFAENSGGLAYSTTTENFTTDAVAASGASSVSISGSLYENDGVTKITSSKTITMVIGTSTPSLHSTTTSSGDFVFNDIATSTIGSWATTTSIYAGNVLSVAYGNGVFVAGTQDSGFSVSEDGVNWTTNSVLGGNDPWDGIVYGGGQFVAVANDGTDHSVAVSPDGTNWTGYSLFGDDDQWGAVAYGNGTYVAVSSLNDKVMYSSDGISWATTSDPAGTNGWNDVIYAEDDAQFVAVASFGTTRVMTSSDGISWTARTPAESNGWQGIAYGNGTYVAVAENGTNRVMTSPNGIDWTARSAAGNDDVWKAVHFVNGQFVAVGDCDPSGDCVMTSPDGENWTAATGRQGDWKDVTYGRGRLVAVSYWTAETGRGMYADAGFGEDTPITIYVDNDTVDATTITSGITGTTTISGISLVQDAVTLQHASTSGAIKLSDAHFYDAEDDSDILLTATSSSATVEGDLIISSNTSVYAPQILYVDGDFTQNGSFFAERGEVIAESEFYSIDNPRLQTANDLGGVNVVGAEISSDGTKFYVIYASDETVREYTLSTPYDTNTASYVNSTSTTAQDTNARDLYFKPDGTSFYVGGLQNNRIYQYDLSSAWDVTTASYVGFIGLTNTPYGFEISSDGSTLIVYEKTSGASFEQYALGTAWDITSATLSQYHNVADDAGQAIEISPDGLKIVRFGQTNGTLTTFGLTQPWDVSTMYRMDTYGSTVSGNVYAATMSDDGQNLYVIEDTTDSINHFSLDEAPTFSGTMIGDSSFYKLTQRGNQPLTFTSSASTTNVFTIEKSAYATSSMATSTTVLNAGSTYTFDSINWRGTTDGLLRLDSSSGGSAWNLDTETITYARYLDVTDSNATLSSGGITTANSTDGTGNTNWTFASATESTVSYREGVDSYAGTEDAYIDSSVPTTPAGSSASISLDGDPDQAGLIRWDLSAIPTDAVIDSVTLTFNITNESDAAFEIYPALQAWTESATWNTYDGSNSWSTAGAQAVDTDYDDTSLGEIYLGSVTTGTTTVSLDTYGVATVQDWVTTPSNNQGFLIFDYTESTNGITLASSENSTVLLRPKIEIVYTEAPDANVWNSTDWTLYDTITIDASNINMGVFTDALYNFPVYVDLSDLSSQFWSTTDSSAAYVGKDIRVTTDEDSPTELPRELVFASSTTQTGELHFKADFISTTTDTVFRIYYNGTTTKDYTTDATYGAENVWPSVYYGVWHMQEDPSEGAGAIKDSTSAGRHGTSGGSMTSSDSVTGKIGNAINFDGIDDYIDVGVLWETLSSTTISVWVNADSGGENGAGRIMQMNTGGLGIMTRTAADDFAYVAEHSTTDALHSSPNGSLVQDSFQHLSYSTLDVTITFLDSPSIIVDGSNVTVNEDQSSSGSFVHPTGDLYIGNNSAQDRTFDGDIDELRISGFLDSNWIEAEYINLSTTTDFYTAAAYVSSQAWNSTDWTNYVEITIDPANIDNTLYDFPVYVDLADMGSDFWAGVSEGGGDIRVVSTINGLNEVPREVVSASTTPETGELHFKAPQIQKDIETIFRIYYNGTTTGDYAAGATYGRNNVWSDYTVVWHMNDSAQYDSAGNLPDSILTGDFRDPLSDANGNLDFDANDEVDVHSTDEGAGAQEGPYADWSAMLHWEAQGTGGFGHFGQHAGGKFLVSGINLSTGSTTVQSGAAAAYTFNTGNIGAGKYLLHATYDDTAGEISLYSNGSLVGTTTGADPSADWDGWEVYRVYDTQYESRGAQTTFSAARVKAEWINFATTTDFYSTTSNAVTLALGNSDAGQADNTFSFNNKTDTEFFTFKLTPSAGSVVVTDLVVSLTGIDSVEGGEISNFELYVDVNNDGVYDNPGDTLVGSGTLSLGEQSGSITFATDFTVSAATNYLIIGDTNSIDNGDRVTFKLLSKDITSASVVTGGVGSVQHRRNNKGGGGGTAAIGGGAPGGDGDRGGGGEGGGGEIDTNSGGDTIGSSPDFFWPTANSGSWNNAANAYDQTDGTYATTTAATTNEFTNFNDTVPSGNTIQGVEVKLEISGTTAAGDIGVEIYSASDVAWSTQKITPTLTTSDAVVTLGGPSDLWGRGWVISDFTNGNFSVRLTGNPSSNEIRVDGIQVKVYHQASGGGGGGGGAI